MLLKVLGTSGAEFPGHYSPSFLIDGNMLLDAGTIGARLSESEQWNIKHILVTHSHLDHIKGIPFLSDNILIKNKRHSITVFGIRETLTSLKKNLLNDTIWPDFTRISAARGPIIKLKSISAERSFMVGRYAVRAYRVNHTVPAVGFVVRADGRVLLYTGDTGPTDEIWSASGRINAAIVEVSFPNRMEELAKKTRHLTPRLLVAELEKIRHFPEKVLITHPKPQYIGRIRDEIARIGDRRISMLEEGGMYEI